VRILIIHNRYQQKGGEDTTFEQELELLCQTELVKPLLFKNHSGWKGAIQFVLFIWNIFAASKVKKNIRQFNPDVIHVHNWHYAIGPLVIRTARKKKIPVVLTVQNYRLLCPSATLLVKGKLFLKSIYSSFPWKAVRQKAYRDSYVLTFWLSFVIWFHRKIGTWRMVDRYILQTEMAKKVFIASSMGIPDSQFTVKPNFIKDPGSSLEKREEYYLYIGRLSDEKGINLLLNVFKGKKYRLCIGGDGPLKEMVLKVSGEYPNIIYLGHLSAEKVRDMMARSSVMVFPSIWYEGMPLTLIESLATGTPIIASNLGAMSSMIKDGFNGLHFTAGNFEELSEKIDIWEALSENVKQQYYKNARIEYENIYTPDRNRQLLIEIYHSVINS
jgi:glycosyltransferase involved in cell wall biosynthesis